MKHKSVVCVFAVVLLLAFQTSVRAAADNILSGNIKEADGTTGQDTNSGSGVKTAHIQNLAVTGAKIANSTILTGNIADSQITGNLLATGAVTDSKISGTISVTKLPVGTSAGTVAAGDHNHDALYQKKVGKVAVVAQSGGDYTSPVSAMSNIAQWCGTPSSSNPCLLKIMPGIYDIGTGTVQMMSWVDIEGSGRNVTEITSASGYSTSNGTVNGASNSELRSLTVRNSGTAVVNTSASPRLTDLSVIAVGGSSDPVIGIQNSYSSPTMRDVVVVASGGQVFGIINAQSSPVMKDVEVTATSSGGGWNCTAITNSDYSSPIMEDITVTSSGGTNTTGLYNRYYSSVVMKRSTIGASGVSMSTGIAVEASTIALADVQSIASGGDDARGIDNTSGAVVTLTNVTAIGRDGTSNNFGMTGGSGVVDRSTLEGASNSITTGASETFQVGASKLVGVAGSGVFTCVLSYNGNYSALGTSCQ